MSPTRCRPVLGSRRILRFATLFLAACLAFAGVAGAQDPITITWHELADRALAGGSASDGKSVVGAGSLRVVGVELPAAPDAPEKSAISATLVLDRIRVFAPDARIVVHTETGERLEAPPANVYYSGVIEDRPGSRAILTLDADGIVRGLVTDPDGWWRIGTVPDKATGAQRVVTRKVDVGEDMARETFQCANDRVSLPSVGEIRAAEGVRAAASPTESSATVVPEKAASYTARIAFETDEDFLADFGGDTVAATDYIGDMVAFATTVYSDQVDTSWLVESVSLWDTTDPWDESSSVCRLFEFGKYWNDNRSDVDRTVAHFLSGGGGFSGIAWVGVLCEGEFPVDTSGSACLTFADVSNYGGDYGYTGGIVGNFDLSSPSPIWDIVALMHEIGHNFDSPHTHCYEGLEGSSSAVDPCFAGQVGDTCYSGTEALPAGCPGPGNNCGTIMSYCHLSSAGNGTISGEVALDLGGGGFPYGTLPERVPTRMNDHVQVQDANFPGCLDFTQLGPIFEDDFESGDTDKWDATQQ